MRISNFKVGAAARLAGFALISTAVMLPSTVFAQRDPDYAAARAAGKVGERTDGYLGIVGDSDAALERLVQDNKLKRKAVYTQSAQEQNATVQEIAFVGGCKAIMKTVPGEKYQDPNGNWQTRTTAPPILSSGCP